MAGFIIALGTGFGAAQGGWARVIVEGLVLFASAFTSARVASVVVVMFRGIEAIEDFREDEFESVHD